MMKYVLGLAFTSNSVVAVKKNRPAWQAGKINFVGGKVEDGETYIQAMTREFEEETGVATEEKDWKYFGTMESINERSHGFNYQLQMFVTAHDDVHKAITMEDEDIIFIDTDKFLVDNDLRKVYISNLPTIFEFVRSDDFLVEGAELILRYRNGN